MKKLLFTFLLAIAFLGPAALASPLLPQDLVFIPAGGGKYIYCNNSEGITNSDLADDTYGAPACIMNNENLGPDKYVLYLSHFNRTTRTDGNGNVLGGYDIELDAAVTAREDCVIRIGRRAFEVPQDTVYYQDGSRTCIEDDWSSLYSCADLMNEPIYKLHSDAVYTPADQAPVTLELPAGETRFLSAYIENYAPVPYPKHVFLAANLEILSGAADLDVIAFNSNTSQMGRETYREKAAFGTYKRDRTQKGVADTLPQVNTELAYTIDDSISDGTKLPVTIYNQFVPEGNVTEEWCTNLNPQDDTYVRRITAESDLLTYRYKDPSKLSFYGSAVPETQRDDIWVFDAFHSDTKEYPGAVSGYTAEDYIPNYPLTTDRDNLGYGCSMGNYGVAVRYHLRIANQGAQDRYLDYVATTTANLIVRVLDENGNTCSPVLAKGLTAEQTTDTLASVRLPAGKTTAFTIEMTLPVQCYGGPRQSFVIRDQETPPVFTQSNLQKAVILYKQPPEVAALLDSADSYTRSVFSGSLDNYKIVPTAGGYAAFRDAVSGQPNYYAYVWDKLNRLYLLDKNFCITQEYVLPRPAIELSAVLDQVYVKLAGGQRMQTDGSQPPVSIGPGELPRGGPKTIVEMIDGDVCCSFDGKTFYPVVYQGSPPPYVEYTDGVFYVYTDNIRWSLDGIYWFDASSAAAYPADTIRNPAFVQIGGKLLGFDRLPRLIDDRMAVPMRFIFETFGLDVQWDPADNTATVKKDGAVIAFRSMDKIAWVNGVPVEMDIPMYNDDGRLLVPIRFLAENLGYRVDWDPENRIANIALPAEAAAQCV